MKENKVFYIAVIVSVVLHIVLLQLFSYQQQTKKQVQKNKNTIMDVALVAPDKAKPVKKPEDAQAIANKNQRAKQEKEINKLKAQVASAPKKEQARHQPQQKIKKDVPQETKPVAKQELKKKLSQSEFKVANQRSQKQEEKMLKPLSEMNFNPSSATINKISQHVQKEHRLQSMLSSEAEIPINTREEKYAPYAYALVRALEEQWQPSDEDYQVYSEQQRQVLLRITINRKGELERVEIIRSSPIASLNESALRALRDAAPYRPLPSSWGFDRVSFRLTFQVVEDRGVFRTL